jgi:hypothetical protein
MIQVFGGTKHADRRKHRIRDLRRADLRRVNLSQAHFSGDGGNDVVAELREYLIPDFSHWQDPSEFEAAWSKLLNDLRTGDNP